MLLSRVFLGFSRSTSAKGYNTAVSINLAVTTRPCFRMSPEFLNYLAPAAGQRDDLLPLTKSAFRAIKAADRKTGV